MQRKPLFLAAAVAETARFFSLAFLANALGGLHEATSLPSFIRYASAAQLIFVLGFFFLWLDRQRYDSYRSLLFVGKMVSLAAFLPFFATLLQAQRSGLGDGSPFVPALAAFAVDAFGFFILLASKPFGTGSPGPRPTQAPPPEQGPLSIEEVENL